MIYLIEKGLNINQRDVSGRTPLHHAAFTGNELFIVYASSFGAHINAIDNEGKTPLILTSKGYEEHRNMECLKKLLLAGADKTIEDKFGMKAIDYLNTLVPENSQPDRYL